MKTIIAILFFLLPLFSMAQHKALPIEDLYRKTKKELFDQYQSYNLKIANDPADADAYLKRSWLRYYWGDTLNSLNDIKKSLELNSKNALAHYTYAFMIIDYGDYETVIEECSEALKYDAKFVNAMALNASALDRLKKPAEARPLYLKAIQIDSTDEYVYLQFAISYMLTNNFNEAKGIITRLLKQFPNSEDGLIYKAKLFMHERDYNSAIKVADLLIKDKKSLTEEYLLKVSAYDSLKNQSKACDCMLNVLLLQGFIDSYEYIMKKCPKEQNHSYIKKYQWQAQAMEAQNSRNFEEAMRLFNEVIKLEPDSGIGYYNRGKLKRKMEDHQGAIEDYLLSIKKAPYFSNAYVAAGVSYTLLGDFDSAKKMYLQSIKVDPLNEMAYYNYANILDVNNEDNNEAIRYYKYAIDIKPNYAKAYYGLGSVYAKLEMNTEACEAFKMADKLGDVMAISKRLWYCK